MCQPGHLLRLCALAQQASDATGGHGSFIEAGCAYGATTVFLNKYMEGWVHHHAYFALDTFGGFTRGDVAVEVEQRGKPRSLAADFAVNNRAWFERDVRDAGVRHVQTIQCDVGAFDFASLAPIAFCLLDVDLYAPTRAALPKIVAALKPGGIIMVDDCVPNNRYDGAEAAYREYCEATGTTQQLEAKRFGIVRAG
jgi:SAM-dependent methyltransferase